jgi:hypothetical protein
MVVPLFVVLTQFSRLGRTARSVVSADIDRATGRRQTMEAAMQPESGDAGRSGQCGVKTSGIARRADFREREANCVVL